MLHPTAVTAAAMVQTSHAGGQPAQPSTTRGNPLNRPLGWDKLPVLEEAGWLPAGRNAGRS